MKITYNNREIFVERNHTAEPLGPSNSYIHFHYMNDGIKTPQMINPYSTYHTELLREYKLRLREQKLKNILKYE